MRIRRAAVALVASLGGLASSMPIAQAEVVETPAGMVSSAQVSVAIDNDWQFQSADCLFIPVVATYGRGDDTSILGELTVTKPSDPSVANDGTFLVLPGDPVSGRVLDEVFVCPADGTGEYRLATLIRAIEPEAEQVFSLDPLTFWVRPAQSRVSELTAVGVKGGVRVSGAVRAAGSDATGIVEVRLRTAESSTWRLVGRLPVQAGAFSGLIERSVPAGARVRATLTECSWCSRASGVTRVR